MVAPLARFPLHEAACFFTVSKLRKKKKIDVEVSSSLVLRVESAGRRGIQVDTSKLRSCNSSAAFKHI